MRRAAWREGPLSVAERQVGVTSSSWLVGQLNGQCANGRWVNERGRMGRHCASESMQVNSAAGCATTSLHYSLIPPAFAASCSKS